MSSLGIFNKETKTYQKVADLSKTAVIDSEMSDTSTNAVQNKVVKKYVDDGVKSSKKLQTYKNGSTTETYGNDYTIYAQWDDNNHVKMKCNNYTVETDYATSAGSAPANGGNSATVNGHTVNSDVPSGAKFTDTVYDDTGIQNEINTLKKSVSDGKTKVANAITDKGVETATDATFDVMAENISKIETGAIGATLAVSTEDSTLFGQTVTLTLNGAIVATTVFADNGLCSFVVQNPGTYTITCGKADKDMTVTGDNVLNKTVISVNLSILKIVTFADGTDEEIAKMIQAHYKNKINIADYWAVGDMRTVHLSAMAAKGVGESHRAQDVKFVIGDFNHDDLTTPVNGHTKAAVTILQKDCLMDASNASNPVNGSRNSENGHMNSTNTNAGGWKNCARRMWCNDVYFMALPTTWRSMVKNVNKKTSVGDGQTTIETVSDKVFLASSGEIIRNPYFSSGGEGTLYQYYKNSNANKIKNPRWSSEYYSCRYWTRSPKVGGYSQFCYIDESTGDNNSDSYSSFGIAPCLCI